MNEVEYFLYDNRTAARWGRDWGLKAQPASLEGGHEVASAFLAYCESTFDTSTSPLSGYGWALGGFPEPGQGRGYVLCVTFEVKDHFGRNSNAIVGLWFKSAPLLQFFLRNRDPFGTAQPACQGEKPPAALLCCRSSESWQAEPPNFSYAWQEEGREDPLADRFQFSDSRARAAGMLLASSDRLPCILGVTSLFSRQFIRSTPFDLIFCHPGSPAAERALEEHLRLHPVPYAGKGPVVISYGRKRAMARLRKRLSKGSSTVWRTLAAVAALAAISSLTFVWSWLWFRPPPAEAVPPAGTQRASGSTGSAPLDPPAVKAYDSEPQDHQPDWEGRLEELSGLLERLGRLDADQLRACQARRIVSEVEVIKKYAERRRRLRRLLDETLQRLQQQLVSPTASGALGLHYYLAGGAGEPLPYQERLKAVREALAQLPDLDPNLCADLRSAFGFEFRSARGPLAEWCSALEAVGEWGRSE